MPNTLKLYNTLTKKIEEIKPSDGKTIRLYTCGPTVYNYVHVGNLRSYIMADLLYRALVFEGYDVEYVMNITDVDDKTIKGTIAEYGPDAGPEYLHTFTTKYLQAFYDDLDAVNIDKENIKFIRVSEVIPQIQEFIMQLIEKGFAYQTQDGVYFSIEKYQEAFGDYGSLIGEKFLEGKKITARVANDEYDKDNLSDFALWKNHSDADAGIFWDHPSLGKGRPGWHIECSVINRVGFGENTIDIHTGGVDLIFPHHTNEIAQSQPLGPFVKHWMHAEHLMIQDDKMSKSKQNFFTLKDIESKGFSGLDLRYMFLQSHYKTQANFTWESIEASKAARNKLNSAATELEGKADASGEEFNKAITEDLNIPKALAAAWDDKPNLLEYDKVFGLRLHLAKNNKIDVPESVQKLLDERQQARDDKEFEKSDKLRDEIAKLGFEVKDTSEGQQLNKI